MVDTAKSSSGPDGFDKGCRWNALEPTSAEEESSYEDPALLDPSSTKYAQANASKRGMRWKLLLEEYGPEIEYIKGPKNVVADALSRLPKQGDILMMLMQCYHLCQWMKIFPQCTSRKSKLNKQRIEI